MEEFFIHDYHVVLLRGVCRPDFQRDQSGSSFLADIESSLSASPARQKIQDSELAESTERDLLRRLLAHMLQGVDWIPHSILLKAADVIRSGPRQIGEGSYGIVRTGQLMVKDERDLQPVAIKTIKWLSSGTQEDRKKLRRVSVYSPIFNLD